MTKIRNALAMALAWIIQGDPGAWQKAARDILNGAITAALVAYGALNLSNITAPGSLSEAKALAIYLIIQIGVPVGWAIVGVLRREVWPLLIDRLWHVVYSLEQ